MARPSQRVKPKRNSPIYISDHVVERVRERLAQKFGTVGKSHVNRMLCGAVFDVQGTVFLMHYREPKDRHQVAVPFLYQPASEVIGYMVIDRDTVGDYELVAKTWLPTTSPQLKDTLKGPLPSWWIKFQKDHE